MWNRTELKERGKASFKKAYGTAIAICLILSVISGIFTTAKTSINKTQQPHIVQQTENIKDSFLNIADKAVRFSVPVISSSGLNRSGINVIVPLITSGAAFATIILTLFAVLAPLILHFVVLVPLLIGSNRFFMKLRDNKSTQLNNILYIYEQGKFANAVLIMVLMSVYTLLWTMLLIIPGIIKFYEYRMIPYILSENPGIKPSRAFKLSKEMMSGNKMDLFLLDLSFMGWYFLSYFTLGLLNILYVNPYVNATNAELYSVLREDVLNRNIADEMDLPGFSEIDTLDIIM
jgi:Predicted integral membrane protein